MKKLPKCVYYNLLNMQKRRMFMFSDIGVPGLILLMIIMAVPTTIIVLFLSGFSRLRRIEEKLDRVLSNQSK